MLDTIHSSYERNTAAGDRAQDLNTFLREEANKVFPQLPEEIRRLIENQKPQADPVYFDLIGEQDLEQVWELQPKDLPIEERKKHLVAMTQYWPFLGAYQAVFNEMCEPYNRAHVDKLWPKGASTERPKEEVSAKPKKEFSQKDLAHALIEKFGNGRPVIEDAIKSKLAKHYGALLRYEGSETGYKSLRAAITKAGQANLMKIEKGKSQKLSISAALEWLKTEKPPELE